MSLYKLKVINVIVHQIRLLFVNNHLSQSQHRIPLVDKKYPQGPYAWHCLKLVWK